MINENEIKFCAQKFGTPLYFYNGDKLKSHVSKIYNSLHSSIEVFFSLKSNNNISIAALLYQWGCGIEVASLGELKLALKAGFSSEKIIFSGPGKTLEELIYAGSKNLFSIIIESFNELKLLVRVAQENQIKINVGIRVNPNKGFSGSSIKMGGLPRQFGIDEDQIDKVIKAILDEPLLQFKGIHVYSGTQILKEDSILSSFEYTLNLAGKIQNIYNIKLSMVNFGGGFGVKYFDHEQDLDFEYLTREINKIIISKIDKFSKCKFIIESGRYLLAKSGTYITKTNFIKKSKGEKFIIVDGGLHHHAAATFRGRMMRNNFPIKVVKNTENLLECSMEEQVHIVGPLCTPEDCLAKNIKLPKIDIGDYICILNSGAYGLTYSPINFLGHCTPPEILFYKTEFHVIRNRGNHRDILLNQNYVEFKDGDYDK